MAPKQKLPSVSYIVANPRGIPKGRHILRVGDLVWFEGDVYDGPPNERFVAGGFLVSPVQPHEPTGEVV